MKYHPLLSSIPGHFDHKIFYTKYFVSYLHHEMKLTLVWTFVPIIPDYSLLSKINPNFHFEVQSILHSTI